MIQKHNILLISRCNTDNFGDKIIGNCAKQLFFKKDWKVKQVDFGFNPPRYFSSLKFTGKIIRIILNPFYKVYCKRMVNKADAVIIGGGELISSTFGEELMEWSDLISKSKSIKKKYLFSVGVTTGFNDEQMRELKRFFSDFSEIYIRDNHSKDIFIEQFSYDKKNIHVIPDCVFSLQIQPSKEKKQIAIGITTRGRHNRHGKIVFDSDTDLFNYYNAVVDDYINGYPGYKIVLIYNTNSDRQISKRFFSHLVKKGEMYEKIIDFPQILNEKDFVNIINKSFEVVSVRMHACIIAMVCGSSISPIVISEKMNYFYEIYCSNKEKEPISMLKNQVLSASNTIIDDIIQGCVKK